MNFLLHHAFASAETGSSVAGVGAMLPDLWRMAHPRVRARTSSEPRRADGALGELDRGVEHHLAIDAWFHRADVFTQGERATGDRLRAVAAPKIGLFAHMAWELCLDGAWVRRADPRDALEAGFREAGDAIDAAAEGHGLERLDAGDRAGFHARVRALRDGLLEGPWVRSYASAPGLAAIVEGMRTRRLGLAPMDGDARRALAEAFEARAPEADDALARLFEARAVR
jgi:hypothetical protein